MGLKTKSQIKSLFVKGAVPTQNNFEDLIDSYVYTVNGHEPDINGNVELPVGFGDSTQGISAHETNEAPHQYGGKFEWRYNLETNSLDLVLL